jgi:hypothetical protein
MAEGRWRLRLPDALALLALAAAGGGTATARAALVVHRTQAPVSKIQCSQLQDAILDQNPKCQPVMFGGDWSGCTCMIPLPANVDQMPNMVYDPYMPDLSASPTVSNFPAIRGLPPPANPAMVYNPPPMGAACPFSNACGKKGGFNCVGYDSFGFSSAHIAEYSAATAYMKVMSCSYIMDKGGKFTVPPKVQAMWRVQNLRKDAIAGYAEKLDVVCPKLPDGTTVRDFCQALSKTRNKCYWTWKELTHTCSKATPPYGHQPGSQGYRICPHECEEANHKGYKPDNYGALKG